jgi:large subunit ribosomal protein L3
MSEEKKIQLPSFYGIKAGMTRVFDQNGNHTPVTVIKLIPNIISQVKTKDKDGYEAYQVAFYEKKEARLVKAIKGHLKKAGISKALARFAEIKTNGVDAGNLGKEISYEIFVPSLLIDVTGTSKGKGTQGVMKRYGFQGGPATHGSHFHRRPGSIGNRATPARVFKEKKMAGHMGDVRETTQNLKVVELNLDKGYLLVKGSVPGAKNSFVQVSKAVKQF